MRGNYRGISLLSVAGKILARIILDRLISTVSEETLPETQCDFSPGRSTIDMVFSVRQIQTTSSSRTFRPFSSTLPKLSIRSTGKHSCSFLGSWDAPGSWSTSVALSMTIWSAQCSTAVTSAPLSISNGVMQGCVLAPVLFILPFACVLKHALRDLDSGVYLRYGLDSSLLNHRRLGGTTKTTEKLIQEILFAKDCDLLVHTEVWPPDHYREVRWGCPPLWSHCQHPQNRGPASASSRLDSSFAYHFHRLHRSEDSRPLQVPRENHISRRVPRQRKSQPEPTRLANPLDACVLVR